MSRMYLILALYQKEQFKVNLKRPDHILLRLHHLNSQTDRIDLVVVGGVWEVDELVEEGVDPGAANEDDLAGLGAVCPCQGAGEFVGGDADTAKGGTG